MDSETGFPSRSVSTNIAVSQQESLASELFTARDVLPELLELWSRLSVPGGSWEESTGQGWGGGWRRGGNLMLLLVHKLQQGHTDMAGCLDCHLQAGVSQEAVSACLQELEEERFAFLAEWYDPSAALLRRYQLLFYPRDDSVEMFDMKNQRTFLRRTKYDELHQEDLFVGNRINVFSRQLNLIGYGDQYTANKLGSKKERTLAMIKPDAVTKVGDIIQLIYEANLIITKAKMTKLTWKQAADFYTEHQSKSFFNNLLQFVTSGPVIAMELMGDEAVSVWRKLLGPTDSSVARKEAVSSLRSQFGTDGTRNAAHGSDSLASAARELEFFFPSTAGHGPPNTANYTDSTCCVIKPHAISETLTGKILGSIIDAGFEITALQMINMDRANAEEFFEVYKGVVTEYTGMVAELCSGPCMALEIHASDAATAFRQFCGPADPEIARHLRPSTLRALYGKNKVQNAVHCTDLPEDSVLEVQYFFKILDG